MADKATTFSRPGISTDMLKVAGIRHVDADEAERLTGLKVSGIWIPFRTPGGAGIDDGGRLYGRLRMDQPSGKKKYHQRFGSAVHPYFPPGLVDMIGQNLVIVEGEFKSLSLVDAGIPAVGISGFCGWGRKVDDAHALHPDLARFIRDKGFRRILFLGDADTALNWQFSTAAYALLKAAEPMEIAMPRLSAVDAGKGVDDIRETLGEGFGAWWEITLATAITLPSKIGPGGIARLLFEREAGALAELSPVDQSEAMERTMRLLSAMRKHPAEAGQIEKRAAKIFGLSVGSIRDEVKSRRREMATAARAKSRDPREEDPDWGPMFTSITEDQETGQIVDGEPAQRYWSKRYTSETEILFEPTEGRFYQYSEESGAWCGQSEPVLAQRLSDQFLRAAREMPDYHFLAKKTSMNRLSALVGQLKGIVEREGAFARPLPFVHCKSSMVGFADGEAVKYGFDPEFFSRNPLPVDPDTSGPPERFLGELVDPAVHPEDVVILQKFFGLWLLRDNPAQQMLILSGLPGRGKTQLAELATLLIGDRNIGSLRTAHLADRFELGRMAGRTLLVGSDVKGDFLEHPGASTLKAIIGGDPIDAELKGRNEIITLRGRFNALVTCNERLRVRIEGDFGAWKRRIAIIPFEGPSPKQRIPDFARRLFEEEGERILAWAIEGARLLQNDLAAHGCIRLTERQVGLVDDLLSESQSLERFVNEVIERAPGYDLLKDEAMEAYGEFCTLRGWEALPLARQQRELPELVLRIHRASITRSLLRNGKAAQGWRNIRLKGKVMQ